MARSNSQHYRRDGITVWDGTQSVFLAGPWEQVDDEEPCRACRGRGYERNDPDEPCSRCHGEGVEL